MRGSRGILLAPLSLWALPTMLWPGRAHGMWGLGWHLRSDIGELPRVQMERLRGPRSLSCGLS